MSNFTSPPCHAMSFFFFPVYPSAIRRVDELALRVLLFPLPSSPPRLLLYHPHSSLCSPLSIPIPPPPLRFFALLTHFTTVVVPSPSPSFVLLFLVSRSFRRFFHDPPLTSFHPSSSPFPLSLRALVPFTHSLFPSRLRRYFLVAPSLPRLYATLLSLSLSLSLSSHPNDRERTSPFPSFFPISLSWYYPSRRLFLFSSGFFFPPPAISIYLSFRSVLSPTNSAAFFPLLLLLVSPRSAGSFSVERLLRFSNVIDASPPRFFPDFSLSRPPFSRRPTNRLFLRENASGNDHSPLSSLPQFSPSRCYFTFPSRRGAGGGGEGKIGIFQETFLRCLLLQSSLRPSPLSRLFLPSFVEMRMIKRTNKICMTTSGFCIEYYTVLSHAEVPRTSLL